MRSSKSNPVPVTSLPGAAVRTLMLPSDGRVLGGVPRTHPALAFLCSHGGKTRFGYGGCCCRSCWERAEERLLAHGRRHLRAALPRSRTKAVPARGTTAATAARRRRCLPPPRQAESASGASFPPAAKSIKSAFHLCGSWPCSGLFYVAPVITPLDQQPGHVPQQFGKCISSINDNRLFKQQLKHSDCFLVCSH